MKPVSIVWHYTFRDNLDELIKDDEIRTTFHCKGCREAVWFSSNPIWEPSVPNSSSRPTIRIGIRSEDAPYNWMQYRQMSGISFDYANGLERDRMNVGIDPGQWSVSFGPVGRNKWVVVQEWDGDANTWNDLKLPKRANLLIRFGRRLSKGIHAWYWRAHNRFWFPEFHRD